MSVKKFNEYVNEDLHPTYEHDNIIEDIKKELEDRIDNDVSDDEILKWMEEYPVDKNELLQIIKMYVDYSNRL